MPVDPYDEIDAPSYADLAARTRCPMSNEMKSHLKESPHFDVPMTEDVVNDVKSKNAAKEATRRQEGEELRA